MTIKRADNNSYQITVILDNNRRVVRITGLDEFDIKNIDNIADPTMIETVREPNLFHDLLLQQLLRWDQDQIVVTDFIEDLRACWADNEEDLIGLALADLNDLYEVDRIDHDRPLYQAVQYGLTHLAIAEIIQREFEHDINVVDRVRRKIVKVELLIAGRALKEIAFGTESEVSIRA